MRRSLVLAAVSAATLTGLGGYAVAREIADGPYGRTDPGTETWHCAGAEVTGTALVRDGRVLVHVTVDDPQLRTWRVRLPSYGHGLIVTGTAGADEGLTAPTGDLDDGPHRRVGARPSGPGSWCDQTVSLR